MSTSTPTPLVDTDWLAAHLDDASIVIAEVDEKPDLYDEGHITGAVRLHWRDDLQDTTRRDVVDQATFEQLLGSLGIARDTTIVLYGDRDNWFAAYAYWYLKLYGHADVRILDGGRTKWIAEGRSMTTDAPTHTETTYTATPIDQEIRAYLPQVLGWLDSDVKLVDVRSPAEFAGELLAPSGYEQEGAQRAGHIPGAESIPWSSAVNAEDSTFKSVEELRELYAAKGITADKPIVAYCRIGERSAHTWFVLHELLGYDDVRNYDGSWTEYGSVVGAPITVETKTPALSAVC